MHLAQLLTEYGDPKPLFGQCPAPALSRKCCAQSFGMPYGPLHFYNSHRHLSDIPTEGLLRALQCPYTIRI